MYIQYNYYRYMYIQYNYNNIKYIITIDLYVHTILIITTI